MCMQCMAGAMAAGASASGTRAYLIARAPHWFAGRRRTILTRGLIAAGLIAASLVGPTPG